MNYALVSVVLFLYSFLGGPLSWACCFVWMIPLFMWQFKNESLSQARVFGLCLWGIVCFSVHFSWVLCLMFTRAVYVWQGILVWLMMIAWFTSWSYLWLWSITRTTTSMLNQFVSTMLFFLFLTRFSLFPCGIFEGYPFIHPLLPLATYPQLLWFLNLIGDVGGFMMMIVFQIFVARLVKHGWSLVYFLLALLCLVPFAIGPFVYQNKKDQHEGLFFLKPWWYGTKNPMYAGYRMLYDLGNVVQKEDISCIQAIVLPESAFCFDVQEYIHFVPLWCDNVDNIPIIFGGHIVRNGVCKNSVFVVRNGCIQQSYDKIHDMPFVERAPTLFAKLGLIPFNLHKTYRIIDVQRMSDDIVELGGKKYQIFICSEFFGEAKSVKGYTVLLMWNDSWLCFSWTKRLAMLFINYFSMKYNVAVVHGSTEGITNMMITKANASGDLCIR